MFSPAQAASLIGGKILNPQGSSPDKIKTIGTIQFDSRQLATGECFAALAGEVRDGHEFIAGALEKGAKSLLVEEKKWSSLVAGPLRKRAFAEAWVIGCDDPAKAIRTLANAWRREFSVPVFAVTGSNGKTTTKDMLGYVLNQVAKDGKSFLFSQGSFNNNIGVPRTLSFLNEDHEGVVLEVGTNHFGELAELAKIAEPNAAMITNIGDSHLEFLRDRRGVLQAKWELVEGLVGKNKVWFVNLDDPILKRTASTEHRGLRKVTFSRRDSKADFYAAIVDKLGMEDNFGYRVRFSGARLSEEVETELRLPGLHNVHNALAAFSVAVDFFGKAPGAVAEALRGFQPLSKYRSEIIRLPGGQALFNDCYNANPSSVDAALKMVGEVAENGFLVAMGELLEVGGRPDEVHFRLGELAARSGAIAVGASGPHAEDIARGAISAGLKANQVLAKDSPEKLVNFFRERLQQCPYLLVKGSRGAKMELLVEQLKGGKG